MPPSAIFYNDTLLPFARNHKIIWSGMPKPFLPLKFIGSTSPEDSSDEVWLSFISIYSNNFEWTKKFPQRASWYNYGEIKEVVNVIKSLLSDSEKCEPRLHAKEIGVMAPWREQVWKLREQLRKESLNAVDVGTVEVSAKRALYQ